MPSSALPHHPFDHHLPPGKSDLAGDGGGGAESTADSFNYWGEGGIS
jgi:hypothetical protein